MQCIAEVGKKKHLLEGVHVHRGESDRHMQSTNSWAHLRKFPSGFHAVSTSKRVGASTTVYLQNGGFTQADVCLQE